MVKITLNKEIKYITESVENIENPIIKNWINNILPWYIKKAVFYKRMYNMINIIVILINASIPVLATCSSWSNISIVVSIMSAVASSLASISSLTYAKDTWHRYRKYTEEIKNELINYQTLSNNYNNANKDSLFIKRIQEITKLGLSDWEYLKFSKDVNKK